MSTSQPSTLRASRINQRGYQHLWAARFILAFFLVTPLAGCNTFSEAKYYLGEIELEINGETVKHSRAWKCEYKTVFWPAQDNLFEKFLFQTPTPSDSFVVKRFGSDSVVLFDNWMGCGPGRRRNGDWTQVTVFDSLTSPNYAERLYLKVGAPVTVHNPFEDRFRTRLIRESVAEIERKRYEASSANPSDEGLDLLYQLRLKAAYGLTVDVLTWNETDTNGLREGLPLNNTDWEVHKLTSPAPKKSASYKQENPVHNSSLVLLPLGYLGPDGRRNPPQGISVKYAGRVIELDQQGYAKIERPEPGIKRVFFFAEIRTNVWAGMCIGVPLPQCPRVPTSSR